LRFFLAISPIFCNFVPSNKSLKFQCYTTKIPTIMQQGNVLLTSKQSQTAVNSANFPLTSSPSAFGRTELAQMYFPYVLPQTAWQKLRGLLAADPALSHLTKLKRRTFLPAEVNIIYQSLGQP
jgi:hypothetical protein